MTEAACCFLKISPEPFLAKVKSEMEGVAKEIIKDLQFDKLNLEGASTKNFEELGGMKGIMDMVKKNHAITKRPMMAKATENIGDGTAKGSSNQMASIASITGAPKSFGFLKK